MASDVATIALAGNPNVGKSTLFNALTGARQHVGNWPGKTVEKKEGRFYVDGREIAVVDLPGTYSLSAYSVEEMIARDFLIDTQPRAVVAVADASNLERNLYLVTQLLELELPLILVLNMADTARNRQVHIQREKLSGQLGHIPVIEMIGTRGVGLDDLRQAIGQLTDAQVVVSSVRLNYGDTLEPEIERLSAAITAVPALAARYNPRWLALKLLEADETLTQTMTTLGHGALVAQASAIIEQVTAAQDEDPETLMTDRRYRFIADVMKVAVQRPTQILETRSDRADRIMTHHILGLPIFLLLMWVVFQFTANVSAPYVDWIDGVINGPLAAGATALLGALGLAGTWVASLVVDGIIAGVGGVLVFVPVLAFLYLAIALLEDSGYMARAAFVMDRWMRALGLHGKSFLPLLLGFGCTVPAIYATRTLENEHDRRLTAFLATFMSCGARLPVYAVFGAAFFGAAGGNLIFGLYILGIGVALATGLVARRTIYRNIPPQPFVMELPPYRVPNTRTVLMQMWSRTARFIRNATTVILACSVALWLLMAIPAQPGTGSFNDVSPEDSLFGTLSHVVSPVFAPAGFGNWQASGALITGFVAKEVIVGTMAQIYAGQDVAQADEEAPAEAPTLTGELRGIVTSFGEATVLTAQEVLNIIPRTVNLIPLVQMPEFNLLNLPEEAEDTSALQASLASIFTPLSAVAFNVFILLYVPCMTATAAIRQEFGKRFMGYQMLYTFGIAWVAAVLVFQIGRLLGLGV